MQYKSIDQELMMVVSLEPCGWQVSHVVIDNVIQINRSRAHDGCQLRTMWLAGESCGE